MAQKFLIAPDNSDHPLRYAKLAAKGFSSDNTTHRRGIFVLIAG